MVGQMSQLQTEIPNIVFRKFIDTFASGSPTRPAAPDSALTAPATQRSSAQVVEIFLASKNILYLDVQSGLAWRRGRVRAGLVCAAPSPPSAGAQPWRTAPTSPPTPAAPCAGARLSR